jgi:hypothetical protein
MIDVGRRVIERVVAGDQTAERVDVAGRLSVRVPPGWQPPAAAPESMS